eukprot:11191308-Lingulodinium_polyedra.AAC.1
MKSATRLMRPSKNVLNLLSGGEDLGDAPRVLVDERIKETMESARWERPILLDPKTIPIELLRHSQELYTINRYYQLGKLPWNMGASVPEALFVPPPSMAVAMHPLSNTPFRLALPKPPTPPPAPPISDPPASTVAAVKTE